MMRSPLSTEGPRSLMEMFHRSVRRFGSREALIWPDAKGRYMSIDYQELSDRVDALSMELTRKGLRPGDRVILLLDQPRHYSGVFFAITQRGAVTVPLDTQSSPDIIHQVARHAEARFILTTKSFVQSCRLTEATKECCLLIEDLMDNIPSRSAPPRTPISTGELTPEHLALLFYTSGTTGNPKAVMLTHGNLLANLKAFAHLGFIDFNDKVVSFLPLHHAYAFTVTLLAPLFFGAAIVYPSGLSSRDLMTCLNQTHPTIFVGVPQVFQLLARSIQEKLSALPKHKQCILHATQGAAQRLRRVTSINFSRCLFNDLHQKFGGQMRVLISGGARLQPEVWQAFNRWGFTLLEGYGLTETAPVSAFNPVERPKAGSVGKALCNTRIKIHDPDEHGVGEVLIQGPHVMAGYYKQPEETAKVIRDQWFHTGDLGYLDRDGYLFLTGRKKEIIVLGSGKNINPEELEDYYLRCRYIKEICVLPFSRDENAFQNSEQLAAILVPNEHLFKQQGATGIRDKLKWELENLSTQLPSYKHITQFVVALTPLPRTRLGKLKRHEARRLFEQLYAQQTGERAQKTTDKDPVSSLAEQDDAREILNFFEQRLNRPVGVKDHLELDLGLDSLGKIEILLALQEHLNLTLSEEQSMNFLMCQTIQELMETLKKYFPNSSAMLKETPGRKKKDNITSSSEASVLWKEILEEPLSDHHHPVLVKRRNIWQRGVSVALSLINKGLFRLFFLLRVKGLENLPDHPYILVPNHASFLDGPAIAAALPLNQLRKTYFLGDSRFLDHGIVKPFQTPLGLIPIQLSFDLMEALKACAFVLRDRQSVCYFPEGQRSIDGDIKPFKQGIGILVKELGIPVVPVYIHGTFQAWPRGKKYPRFFPVRVTFGPSVTMQDMKILSGNTDLNYSEVAQCLRDRVEALKKSQYSSDNM